jgi:hypothetical protein
MQANVSGRNEMADLEEMIEDWVDPIGRMGSYTPLVELDC